MTRLHRLNVNQTSAIERARSKVGGSLLHGAAVVLVAMTSVACGGSDGGEDTNEGVVGLGTQPCETFSSGFEGDELCIAPPPPDKGFQLRYGPKSYDDEGEVAKYLIHPGEEITDCIYTETPNETEVFMSEYHGRLRPGSHHMITFTMPNFKEAEDGPTGCAFGGGANFLVGAQEQKTDVDNSKDAPELAGHALKIEPKMPAAVQVHFINVGDKPILREAWVNGIYADPDTVEVQVEPLFWIGGLTMNIKPKTQEVLKAQCVVGEGAPEGLKLLQVTGHYHAHTNLFKAWKVDGATGAEVLIYESYNYKDPGFAHYNSVMKNPKPGTGDYGSDHNGELFLKPGDKVKWECHVDNKSDVTLKFGNAVYEAEMCNIFGVSAPSFHEENVWNCYTP